MKRRVFVMSAMAGTVAAAMGLPARAQQKEVKVGLLVPLSGIYARPGQVMRMGAEMAIEHINGQGGVQALGGARWYWIRATRPRRRRTPHSAWWRRRPTSSPPPART
jgi:hypothetical protein